MPKCEALSFHRPILSPGPASPTFLQPAMAQFSDSRSHPFTIKHTSNDNANNTHHHTTLDCPAFMFMAR